MSFITGVLDIIETALRNPEDKAAVKIAIDAIALWRDVSADPKLATLEADIGAYVALLPKAAKPAPAELPDPPSSVQPSADTSDHAHGSVMRHDL